MITEKEKPSFNDISRSVWQEMRKGSPFAPPPPNCGEFVNLFYGNNDYEGIDFNELIKFLKAFPGDAAKYLDWNSYAKGSYSTGDLLPAQDGIYSYTVIPNNIHYEYADENGKLLIIELAAKLNKRICYLSNDYAYTIQINPSGGKASVSLNYYYEGTEAKRRPAADTPEAGDFRIDDMYKGIQLMTESFDDMAVIVKALHGASGYNSYVQLITEKFARHINTVNVVDDLPVQEASGNLHPAIGCSCYL
jgi:hypothetical protein